jgi:hypothetical protein
MLRTPPLLRPFAVVAVVIGFLAAAATGGGTVLGQAADDGAALSIGFGPSQIWQPSQDAVRQLQMCTNQSYTCVRGVMQQNGASAGAIAFYRLTGWFLSDIEDHGPVQLGTIFTPWAANENTQYALLGGIPAVIFPNQDAATFGPALQHNDTYAAIASAHEDAMYWPFGPTVAGVETSPAGGPRFLFDYEVLNGCHACAILAHVRLAFDFAADGTEAGVHLIEVIPAPPPADGQ